MHIRTQLLKKWVGPDPEKHIGSTPLSVHANKLCYSRYEMLYVRSKADTSPLNLPHGTDNE